ncbi:hypothetical protein Q5424_21920 [Conexibacter sp. JD483]|uniref:hypothetical protein n=1 Tax=unclassified Conexibacter TaxID=2627773 RepID=UPI00271AE356|nr:MULTISPECIES: hypothetical protein [unclassified Conexibacter]MDO8187359.1 hypothetical protein [Conexibacter sp. CPCC 205706]MDO8200508.1 hypothetical protein [Conexibacter sp. CPCC 205762]MDR9371770.1 hypothetical protein [Conexibacter sp. JD483]
MKKLLAAAAAATLAFGAATPSSVLAGNDAPQAQIACKRATIGGQSRCIAAGQFCARAYERDYNRYGYSCSNRDRNGRYHLRYR